jgi:hypothetical protein
MKRASAPGYDLFKLAVAVILIIILLLMLLRGYAPISAAQPPPAAEPVVSDTSTPVLTETDDVSPSNTPELPEPSATSTAMEPTATGTSAAAVTPESTVIKPTATLVTPAEGTSDSASCNTSVPSRLSVGQTARVVQRLNMRSQPSITASILQTNPTGAQVEIIGGPVCTSVGDSAYLWWEIRLTSGTEGWSAESPLNDATYLLEPVQ